MLDFDTMAEVEIIGLQAIAEAHELKVNFDYIKQENTTFKGLYIPMNVDGNKAYTAAINKHASLDEQRRELKSILYFHLRYGRDIPGIGDAEKDASWILAYNVFRDYKESYPSLIELADKYNCTTDYICELIRMLEDIGYFMMDISLYPEEAIAYADVERA